MKWCKVVLWTAVLIAALSISYLVVRYIGGVHGTAVYYAAAVLVASILNSHAYRHCTITSGKKSSS